MTGRAHKSAAEAHHRAFGRLLLLAFAAPACVLVGVWGLMKLADHDLFIGVGFVACAAIGLARILARLIRAAPPG